MGEGHADAERRGTSSDLQAITRAITRDEGDFAGEFMRRVASRFELRLVSSKLTTLLLLSPLLFVLQPTATQRTTRPSNLINVVDLTFHSSLPPFPFAFPPISPSSTISLASALPYFLSPSSSYASSLLYEQQLSLSRSLSLCSLSVLLASLSLTLLHRRSSFLLRFFCWSQHAHSLYVPAFFLSFLLMPLTISRLDSEVL